MSVFSWLQLVLRGQAGAACAVGGADTAWEAKTVTRVGGEMALVRRVAGKAVVGKAVRNRPRDGGYKATRAQNDWQSHREEAQPGSCNVPHSPRDLEGGR